MELVIGNLKSNLLELKKEYYIMVMVSDGMLWKGNHIEGYLALQNPKRIYLYVIVQIPTLV